MLFAVFLDVDGVLNTRTTWKELLHEPLEDENVQEIIKSDSVKIVDLGICKMALPN